MPAIPQDALAVHVDVESENAATANHKEGDVEEVREGLQLSV